MLRPGEGAGEDRAELARHAFAAGRAASDPDERIAWLDRAHRLLPTDPTFALVLAQALLGRDDARAARLLRPVVAANDVREAWLTLAAAHRGARDAQGAADALQQALSRHAFPPELAPFAEAIAREAGHAGWCALAPDGSLLSGPTGMAIWRSNRSGRIHVRVDGDPLLGSPLLPARLEQVEGFVEWADDGGVRGWAWRPSNPDQPAALELRDASGRSVLFNAEDESGATGGGLLARRRAFALPAAWLSGLRPPIRILTAKGTDLLGSPLPPITQTCADPFPPPPVFESVSPSCPRLARPSTSLLASGKDVDGRATPGHDGKLPCQTPEFEQAGRIAIIIPVHGGGQVVRQCVNSVLATLPDFAHVIVVDDGAPEAALARWFDSLAKRERITLVRLRPARGFPSAANAGLTRALGQGQDAVLLNSDTLVAGPWLADLREAAYSAPDIGTVTPFSNSGSILSYPGRDQVNPVPDLAGTRLLAAAARAANGRETIEIPVGVGFCLYVRADCLRATGLLRTDLFAQGYGEENDFCLRARRLGWRNVAAPGMFVAHVGGASMGGAAEDLRRRNAAILERLHPGYHAAIATHMRADPLLQSRRALDLERWRARGRPARTVALVTHDQGGGVERAVAAEIAQIMERGEGAILLRPARLPDGTAAVRVEDSRDGDFPNLLFGLPGAMTLLRDFLTEEGVRHVAIHHLLGHAPELRDLPGLLGVPHSVHVHDYSWLCPRVVLLGAGGRYCGEPDLAGCARCVATAGSFMDETNDAAALRERSARLLHGAVRVVTPSADTAKRIARYFPSVDPVVVPHEEGFRPANRVPIESTPPLRVAVIGAIGPAKGYDVLLGLARDAAARGLPLSFRVVGHTTGDAALMATGRVFVTGPFAPYEAECLIRAQNAAMAFIPSVVPETWCYALTEALRAGLRVAAFDIGAQAERIRAHGEGLLLPLALSARRINDALLAACGVFLHKGPHKESGTGSRCLK